MKKTLVLYESIYGFTERLAEKISLILGPAKRISISELNINHQNYDNYVICVPIYLDQIDSSVLNYIADNAAWLKQKKIILICTCLAVNLKEQYLKPLAEVLDNNIHYSTAVAGDLILERLSPSDYKLIKQFFKKTGFPCQDYKLFNEEQFVRQILDIKHRIEKADQPVDKERLFHLCEDFIKTHNTCTLATGYGTGVRATPIEYVYRNSSLYMLSEGGEKYANLLLNPKVSISIFNEYQSMKQLAGMQITGDAEIIPIGNDEYISILEQKNLNYEEIRMLPVTLNLIRITMNKIEFLCSDFLEMGYDQKQIFLHKE